MYNKRLYNKRLLPVLHSLELGKSSSSEVYFEVLTTVIMAYMSQIAFIVNAIK